MENLVNKKVRMRLEGLDGNCFMLIGSFMKKAKKQGWTAEEIGTVVDEAQKGDYDHLLQVLITHTE